MYHRLCSAIKSFFRARNQEIITQDSDLISDILPMIFGFFWDARIERMGFNLASESSKRIFGVEPDTLCSPSFDLLSSIHPEDRRIWLQKSEVCRTQGKDFFIELRVSDRQGGYRWFRFKTTIRVNTPDYKEWFGVCEDITDLHEMVSSLERSRSLLHTMEKVLLDNYDFTFFLNEKGEVLVDSASPSRDKSEDDWQVFWNKTVPNQPPIAHNPSEVLVPFSEYLAPDDRQKFEDYLSLVRSSTDPSAVPVLVEVQADPFSFFGRKSQHGLFAVRMLPPWASCFLVALKRRTDARRQSGSTVVESDLERFVDSSAACSTRMRSSIRNHGRMIEIRMCGDIQAIVGYLFSLTLDRDGFSRAWKEKDISACLNALQYTSVGSLEVSRSLHDPLEDRPPLSDSFMGLKAVFMFISLVTCGEAEIDGKLLRCGQISHGNPTLSSRPEIKRRPSVTAAVPAGLLSKAFNTASSLANQDLRLFAICILTIAGLKRVTNENSPEYYEVESDWQMNESEKILGGLKLAVVKIQRALRDFKDPLSDRRALAKDLRSAANAAGEDTYANVVVKSIAMYNASIALSNAGESDAQVVGELYALSRAHPIVDFDSVVQDRVHEYLKSLTLKSSRQVLEIR